MKVSRESTFWTRKDPTERLAGQKVFWKQKVHEAEAKESYGVWGSR